MSSPEPARLLWGGCACGACRLEVEDAFAYAMNCHCSACRRATGSAFKPFAGIERPRLRLTQGADALLIVGEAGGDHDMRCARCGSLLASVVRGGAWVHLPLGVLDEAPSLRPTHHIWVSSKAPWFEISDDLPQHAEF